MSGMPMTSVRFREILLRTRQLIIVHHEEHSRRWFTLETTVDGRTRCILSMSRTSLPKRFSSPDKVTRLVTNWGLLALTMPLKSGEAVNPLSAAACRAIESSLGSGRRKMAGYGEVEDIGFPRDWGPIGKQLAAGPPPEQIAASSGLPLETVHFLVSHIRDGNRAPLDGA